MKKQKAARGTVKRVLRYIGRYKFLLLLSLLLAAASVAMTLYLPLLIGNVIDCFVSADAVDYALIGSLLAKICLFVLLTVLAQWLMNTVNNRITFHIVRDVRNDAFARMQRLPLSYLAPWERISCRRSSSWGS